VYALILGSVVALSVAGLQAQQTPTEDTSAAPPSIDRRLGEEEQIERRREWFFSTRTAGTRSDDERARLRWDGVLQTRTAIELQRTRRAESGAQQNPWVPKGPSPSGFGSWAFGNVAGRTTALAADWSGGILYLGTASGGLWKSLDDGVTWTQLFDSVGTMTIGAVAVDPNDPDVIWAGTGDNMVGCESYFGIGLMRSADGGLTWEARNGSAPNTLDELASFANVVIDPRDSDHLVVGGRIRQCSDGSNFAGGIYSSDDGGLNWTQRLASTEIYEIAQDPAVMDIYWAATNNGIFKSIDNGVTWIQQTASGLPAGGSGRCELAIAPSASNTVYALFSGQTFWRTTDGGATWTQMTSGSNACDGQCWYNMVLRVHRTDPDTVYRGTILSFKSVDGGASWTDLTGGWGSNQKVHQDTHVLLMHPTDTDKHYVGTDGGLWKSEDGGATFTNLNGNLNTFQFYTVGVDAQDPEIICGGAQDNSSVARAGNNLWSLQVVSGDGFTCHFNPQDGNYAYVSSYPSGGYPNVWRSTAGPFGSFFDVSGSGSGVTANDRNNWVVPYQIDPVNPNILYLGTHRIYRSDDHGSNWTQMGPDLTGNSGSLLNIDINRNFPDTVLTSSGSGKVWRTTDGAANWTDITTGLPARAVNDVASDPTDPDRAFAVVGGFNTSHVWEWTAAGGWTEHSNGLPNVPHNSVLMISSVEIVVATDTGEFRSVDGGETFEPFMDGLPQGTVVTDLKYNLVQNVLTAGTYGRGAWQTALGPVSPILLFEGSAPAVEVDGNGNGAIEPGETWGVEVSLRNGGAANALATQGTVTTSTPGVTLIDGGLLTFGDIGPGGVNASQQLATFIVDPSTTCGDTLTFDLVGLTTANDPGPFGDVPGAFSVDAGGFLPPVLSTLLDDDFDPAPDSGWNHEAIDPVLAGCNGTTYVDEWKVLQKDATHLESYHAGRGASLTYSRSNAAWLHYAGKDSQGGAGLTISPDAISATLSFDHWYETEPASDGGVVLVDSSQDGADNYSVLYPAGGYPSGTLATGGCNALEGLDAFHGDSINWVTSTFDLLPYAGQTIYVAFVFGSDNAPSFDEGWYIDNIRFEYEEMGDAICDPLIWPGSVPRNAMFDRTGGGTIEATWGDSCNVGALPGQQYSIQVGDLDSLRGGAYDHVPLDGSCGQSSPTSFAFGSGSQYFLIVPNDATHEGGAGIDSNGARRPSDGATCGIQRVDSCN
jgi:hypothetical protein